MVRRPVVFPSPFQHFSVSAFQLLFGMLFSFSAFNLKWPQTCYINPVNFRVPFSSPRETPPLSHGPSSRDPHFRFLLSKSLLLLRPLSRGLPIPISAFQRFSVSAFVWNAFQLLNCNFRPSHGPSSRSPLAPFLLSKCPLLLRPLSRGPHFCFLLSQFLFLFGVVSFFETASAQTNLVTPAQYLASQPLPNFAPGNHLLPLTRYGWSLDSNTTVELARDWGYALEIGLAQWPGNDGGYFISTITNPASTTYGLIQLAKSDPAHFKLSVITSHEWLTPVPNDFYVTNSSGYFVGRTNNTFQYLSNGTPVVSPESPDAYLALAASNTIWPIRVLNSNAPISMIINGGEYGLDVYANGGFPWLQDPRVQAKGFTNFYDTNFVRYASLRKARELGFLTTAINQTFTNRLLSLYYNTGAEELRIQGNDRAIWRDQYAWDSDVMNTNTDLPAWQVYYQGTYTNNYGSILDTRLPAWTPDLLTQYLNAVGFNAKLGYQTNYTWVSGGWETGNPYSVSPIPIYMGLLKCLYTGGMVGGNAGCYSYPAGGFDASFDPTNPPYWIPQLMALSRVHAHFTYLESFLTNGALLPSPSMHGMSQDQPAYEFTNSAADPYVRVLARKMNNTNLWLICAWAQNEENRHATVTIPNHCSFKFMPATVEHFTWLRATLTWWSRTPVTAAQSLRLRLPRLHQTFTLCCLLLLPLLCFGGDLLREQVTAWQIRAGMVMPEPSPASTVVTQAG